MPCAARVTNRRGERKNGATMIFPEKGPRRRRRGIMGEFCLLSRGIGAWPRMGKSAARVMWTFGQGPYAQRHRMGAKSFQKPSLRVRLQTNVKVYSVLLIQFCRIFDHGRFPNSSHCVTHRTERTAQLQLQFRRQSVSFLHVQKTVCVSQGYFSMPYKGLVSYVASLMCT